jgi:hypothetical protein
MKQFFILLTAATTLLLGCSKSYEKFDPNVTIYSDSIWANMPTPVLPVNDLSNNIGLSPSIDSVSGLSGGTIYFSSNIIVTVPANAFLMNGTPVTDGKVTIRFLLITKKGDMIRMSRPTQSNGYLLENGGEIYLDAIKNNKLLTLATGKQITISYRTPYQPSALMQGFTGVDAASMSGSTSCANWLTTPATNVNVSALSNGYQIVTSSLSWISCNYYNDTASAKTTVALSMPLLFTNANTYTFIVYKNSNGIMQFDADATNKIWVKNRVPINKSVIFVTISKLGGDYYLGVSETTTTTNQHVVIKPSKQKLQDIIYYLGTL